MTMYAKWVETDGRFAFSDTNNGGVEILDADYAALFAAQQEGKIIANDGQGNPVAIDEPVPEVEDGAAPDISLPDPPAA